MEKEERSIKIWKTKIKKKNKRSVQNSRVTGIMGTRKMSERGKGKGRSRQSEEK